MNSPMWRLITCLLASCTRDYNNPIIKAAMDAMPRHRIESNPAFLKCQLVLKGGYAAAGYLTTTESDTLRLLAPAKTPEGGDLIADHYFDYDDVLTIVIGRDMPSVTPPRAGSSIILG